MSSLHARRPPKLEQGDLRRNRQKRGLAAAGHHSQIKGGGSLRRPPSAVGMEGSSGGGSGGSQKKKFCSMWRIISSVLVVLLLAYLFVQVKYLLAGSSNMEKGANGYGLRASQMINLARNSDSVAGG